MKIKLSILFACLISAILLIMPQISFTEEPVYPVKDEINNDIENTSTYISVAKILRQNDQFALAAQILSDGYDKVKDVKILKEWASLNKEWFLKFPAVNISQQWQDPFKELSKEMEKIYPEIMGKPRVLYAPFDDSLGKIIKHEKYNPVQVINITEANVCLIRYNELKKSLKNLESVYKTTIRSMKNNNTEELSLLLSQSKDLSNKVKTARSDYVSYNLINPYLQRAKQLMFLYQYDKKFPFIKQHHYLTDATLNLQNGTTKDVLLQVKQDVRSQFLEVYKIFKDNVGEAENGELKVVQTLADKISTDEESILGEENWWKKEEEK